VVGEMPELGGGTEFGVYSRQRRPASNLPIAARGILVRGGVMIMTADIRYEIILYWSNADQAFVAEVPELPGCSADGATYQQAIANAEIVIQEWIETAQELGRPIPEPRGRLLYA
jgi:predicted RNase H-like HicB family nuclease